MVVIQDVVKVADKTTAEHFLSQYRKPSESRGPVGAREGEGGDGDEAAVQAVEVASA